MTTTNTADHLKAIQKLEQRRFKAVAQLQQIENRKGACGNPSQLIARENIERMDTTLAAMKANQPFEPFRASPNHGLILASCTEHPKLERFGVAPVTPEIAAGRQQADARSSAKDIAYNKGLRLLAVTKVRSLEFASKSRLQAQLEARVDVKFVGSAAQVPSRINYQMILTPKAEGTAIYFRGRLPALGQSGDSGDNVQLFATVSRPEGLSDRLVDYRVSAVVTQMKYPDGSDERLVTSLGDFKIWLAAQATSAP